MTKEQQLVREFMLKAGQECPSKPTIPDLKTRKLRARLMLEEVLETINDGLGLEVLCETGSPEGKVYVNIDGIEFLEDGPGDLVELADGLGDQMYVAYCGTGLACGIDMEPVFEEIDRSNKSKFIDGYVDEGGKYRKGPSFRPPDIKTIIEKQSA